MNQGLWELTDGRYCSAEYDGGAEHDRGAEHVVLMVQAMLVLMVLTMFCLGGAMLVLDGADHQTTMLHISSWISPVGVVCTSHVYYSWWRHQLQESFSMSDLYVSSRILV